MRRMRTLDPSRRCRIPIDRPSPSVPAPLPRSLFLALTCIAVVASPVWPAPSTLASTELRGGGAAEGGAPYVEADPADPSRVVGFDVEIAELLASGLGRTARFIQTGFTSIDASTARGDFDVALSGIEDAPARRARL